jgi:hypothetical protein
MNLGRYLTHACAIESIRNLDHVKQWLVSKHSCFKLSKRTSGIR